MPLPSTSSGIRRQAEIGELVLAQDRVGRLRRRAVAEVAHLIGAGLRIEQGVDELMGLVRQLRALDDADAAHPGHGALLGLHELHRQALLAQPPDRFVPAGGGDDLAAGQALFQAGRVRHEVAQLRHQLLELGARLGQRFVGAVVEGVGESGHDAGHHHAVGQAVEHGDAALVFRVPQDRPALVADIFGRQVGAIDDRGLAPVGRQPDALAVLHAGGDVAQALEEVAVGADPGYIDLAEHAGSVPARHLVGAGQHDVRLEAGEDLLQPFLFIGVHREARRPAMLLHVAGIEVRDVVAGPGEDGRRFRRQRRPASAAGGDGDAGGGQQAQACSPADPARTQLFAQTRNIDHGILPFVASCNAAGSWRPAVPAFERRTVFSPLLDAVKRDADIGMA